MSDRAEPEEAHIPSDVELEVLVSSMQQASDIFRHLVMELLAYRAEERERERTAGALSANEVALLQVEGVLRKQQRAWLSPEQGSHPEWRDWLGLITQYAETGWLMDAAALCILAHMERERKRRRDRMARVDRD